MIVEVLDRHGVRSRHWLTAFPATIGRGYLNDVILDDRYVDGTHARVVYDGTGGLVLEDAGSANGLHSAGRERATRIPLRSGTQVRLGHTWIRFVDPAQPVEPALRDGLPVSSAAWTSRPVLIGLALAGTFLLLTLNSYLESADRVSLVSSATTAIYVLLAVLVWAGVWSLVGRITAQRFRFTEHFALAALAVSAVLLGITFGEYVGFLWPGSGVGSLIQGMVSIAAGVTLVAEHLARVSAMTARSRWLASLSAVGALVALVSISSLQDDSNESADLSYAAELKPLPPSLIPTTRLSDFLGGVEELRAEVDAMVEDSTASEPDSSTTAPE